MFTFLLHPKPKDKHCLKWLWPWKIQRYYKLCSQSFRLKVLLIQNLVPIIGMFQKFIHCENMNFYDQKISENGTVFSHFVLKTSQETWLVFFIYNCFCFHYFSKLSQFLTLSNFFKQLEETFICEQQKILPKFLLNCNFLRSLDSSKSFATNLLNFSKIFEPLSNWIIS